MLKRGHDIITRCSHNPLIGLDDVPFRCSDIWNAGVTMFEGKYLLLVTIETLEGHCRIHRALSDDGVNFDVDAEPFMAPLNSGPNAMYENVSVRDARITPLDDTFYITYAAEGDHGLRVGLCKTQDFQNIERMGYLSQVDVKNGILFPQKINGKYALLTRPDDRQSIWLTFSEDLEFWGEAIELMTPRGGYWDCTRIGSACTPIATDCGWLLIYYGEKHTSAGPLVRLGVAMLDLKDPSKLLARSNVPILSPRERYERIGDLPNVVFSCGAFLQETTVVLYYGASDSCICRGTADLSDFFQICADSKKEF